MTMLSTLSVAVDVHQSIRARRAGQDPSSQEPTGQARAYVLRILPDLHHRLARLRTSKVAASLARTQPLITAHRFQQMMILRRLNRNLHLIHQRLLSLYPAISELLVEEARLLESDCRMLVEEAPDDLDTQLNTFLNDGLDFAIRLETELI